MGPIGTGRVYESAISRERARARIEEDEAKKRRGARGGFSNNTTGKEVLVRETLGGSTQRGVDEAND